MVKSSRIGSVFLIVFLGFCAIWKTCASSDLKTIAEVESSPPEDTTIPEGDAESASDRDLMRYAPRYFPHQNHGYRYGNGYKKLNYGSQPLQKRPVYQTPKRPVYQTPKRPIYQTPKRPVYQTPKRPVYQTPKRPVYQTPKRPVYQTPYHQTKPKEPYYYPTQKSVISNTGIASKRESIVGKGIVGNGIIGKGKGIVGKGKGPYRKGRRGKGKGVVDAENGDFIIVSETKT